MSSLETAFSLASPRLSPRKTPLLSHAIHALLLVFSVILFSRVIFRHDVFAWSSGIAYVTYDTILLLFVAWQTLPLLKFHYRITPVTLDVSLPINDEKQTELTSNKIQRPTLGVIIAAYNEADVLEKTINSLFAQSDVPDQILIADDGSDDASAALIERVYGCVPSTSHNLPSISTTYPNLIWLRVAHGGKARALNQAMLHLNTDIMITVDVDTLLAPNAIAEMRTAFAKEKELVAATGVLSPVCADNFSGHVLQWFQTYEYIRNFISRFAWMRQDGLLLISGAFASFRRQALLDVGGFDAQCLVEDYELIHRLRRYAVDHQLDWRIRVIGSAQGRTSAPSNVRSFLLQRRRWFAGFLQTQHWNRDMIGNAKYGTTGKFMLPIKAIDTIQPFYGVFAFFLLLDFIFTTQLSLLAAISAVIGTKILIDLIFHTWSIYLYRRWTGDTTKSKFSLAILAALFEPFTFQLLRHTGALMGWYYFLTGQQRWGKQQRHQI